MSPSDSPKPTDGLVRALLAPRLPDALCKHVYAFARFRTPDEYAYRYRCTKYRLFYDCMHPVPTGFQRDAPNPASRSYWMCELVAPAPLHAGLRLLPATLRVCFDYDEHGVPVLDGVRCYQDGDVRRYPVADGWRVAFHANGRACDVVREATLDTWERARWNKRLARWRVAAYLDNFLQYRRLRGTRFGVP